MYCTNCGKPVDPMASACTACGFRPKQERNYCANCGTRANQGQAVCLSCGASLRTTPSKSKVAAGLLALFLGGLGVHKFYLGYTKEGLIMLLASVIGGLLTLGIVSGIIALIALVEGIIYLTKSDEDFDALYVSGQKGWL